MAQAPWVREEVGGEGAAVEAQGVGYSMDHGCGNVHGARLPSV